jgi:hypothetical protein
MSKDINRREFIKVGSALTAGIPFGLAASNLKMPPNQTSDSIRLGVIGLLPVVTSCQYI